MVSIETIAAAELLFGVDYTPAERAQMVDNLEGQIASALARRRVPLANDAPMASRFDPRLPTTRLPDAQAPVRYATIEAPCPSDAEAIAFAPLTPPLGLDPHRRPQQPAADRDLSVSHRGAQPPPVLLRGGSRPSWHLGRPTLWMRSLRRASGVARSTAFPMV